MAKIETLVQDVSKLLEKTAGKKNTVELTTEVLGNMGISVAKAMQRSLSREDGVMRKDPNVIYASELGNKCLRQLFYKHMHPNLAETLRASNRFKFFYGDIVEEAILALVQLAGHSVTDRQKEIEIAFPSTSMKVRGRIDALIDGVLVDVKSVTTRGFEDFKNGKGGAKFGYAHQLAAYEYGLKTKDKGFLYVDRQLGHFGYAPEKTKYTETGLTSRVQEIEHAISDSTLMGNDFKLSPEPEGASGNMKLCTECSYCAFKKHCWQDSNDGKGLRTFAYSNKVMFLTKVAKEPKVPEIK